MLLFAPASFSDAKGEDLKSMVGGFQHYPGMMLGWDNLDYFLYEEQPGENELLFWRSYHMINYFSFLSGANLSQSKRAGAANFVIFALTDIAKPSDFEKKITEIDYFKKLKNVIEEDYIDYQGYKNIEGCYLRVSIQPDKNRFLHTIIWIDTEMDQKDIFSCLEATIPATFGVDTTVDGDGIAEDRLRKMNALGHTPAILTAFGICREEDKDESVECVTNKIQSLHTNEQTQE